jgi:cytochrome c-type biogenesis protein CcmF
LETARRAGIAGFVAVTAAAFALLWAIFANDFSLAYIVEHSNRSLPAAYKFSALWAGQEGSLLLWAWLLGAFGLILRRSRGLDKLYACAGAILAGIQAFFLLLLCFPATPFALIPGYVSGGPIPADGNGLNPLLQYPEMVLHPPLLYLGYVGFSVPFAFALAALIVRDPGERWIRITRRWTMASWLFLTLGIFLGMHWAYAVLGWGGYWSWDPVENASLMPWLTGTAFLHSVIMQERKGMMKSWNVWLIFSTFLLTLVGTMLTRGGLVSSVHAFAASPIGYWFMVFIAVVLAMCIFAYIQRREALKSARSVEALVSRESSFLFGCMVLLAACFVILWGTLSPTLTGFISGSKVTIVVQQRGRAHRPFSAVSGWRGTAAALAGDLVQKHSPQLRAAADRVLPHALRLPSNGLARVGKRHFRSEQLLRAARLCAGGGRGDDHLLGVLAWNSVDR